jgi:hypothetical protein
MGMKFWAHLHRFTFSNFPYPTSAVGVRPNLQPANLIPKTAPTRSAGVSLRVESHITMEEEVKIRWCAIVNRPAHPANFERGFPSATVNNHAPFQGILSLLSDEEERLNLTLL